MTGWPGPAGSPAHAQVGRICAAQRLVSSAGTVDGVELRDALVRRPVMPERRIAIREAILRIERLVDRGDDATDAIETLNATTITRDELVEVVRHILADPTDDWYIEVFELNTVRPGASDLIFHPPPELQGATAEQIVDAALAYRPIAL